MKDTQQNLIHSVLLAPLTHKVTLSPGHPITIFKSSIMLLKSI